MKRLEKHCNQCGKRIIDYGNQRKDYLEIEKQWGYFSRKDGEKHSFVLCENCYDLWIKNFKISPTVEEITEFLS